MPIEAPQNMGDMLPQADVLGHPMVVCPTEWIEHLPTKNTKPGEKSPAIRVHIADFMTDPQNPTVYRDVLWFGVIQGPLRRQIGKFLASVMSQGVATQGNNPPWQLKSLMDNPDWVAYMGNWLDNTPAGAAFQAEANESVRIAQNQPTTVLATPEPAVPAAPAAPPAAPPRTAPPAAPPSAPAAPPAAPVAAPAGNAGLEALLAAMPADQRAAAMAVLGNQGQAAH